MALLCRSAGKARARLNTPHTMRGEHDCRVTQPAREPNHGQDREEAESIVRDLGATDEQIGATHSLAALGSDLVLAQGRPWSLRALANEIGISVEDAARIYRSLGEGASPENTGSASRRYRSCPNSSRPATSPQ